MTGGEREAIVDHVEKVGREWRSGQATEHTCRPLDNRFTCYTGKSRGLYSSPQLYDDDMGKVEKEPNFDKAVFERISAAVGEAITPEDVFNCIYGVLHTPGYREKYDESRKAGG